MKNQLKYYHYTGKQERVPENSITLDSNMVGYLYALNSPQLTIEEYVNIKRKLNATQLKIVEKIIDNNFEGIEFKTTPQVIEEVQRCACLKKDPGIVNFLAKLCKIRIPRTQIGKVRYAELIVDLMEKYTERDIALSDDTREYQSAVASEIKNGVENFADAKIVAENNILNGAPLVTRNEKHLVSMEVVKFNNNLRSEAILDKNKKFLKSHKMLIPNKTVRMHLKSKKATTFRITDIPHLLDN